MSRKNKSIDLAFQKVQEPLVEGLSALALLSDRLVKDVQSSKTTNRREVLNQVMDAIAILGNANWRLNMKRREIVKPELNPPYTRLCKEKIKPSQKLFGDDLSKHLKEMTDAKRRCKKVASLVKATSKKATDPSLMIDHQPAPPTLGKDTARRTTSVLFLGYGRASTQTNQKKNNNNQKTQ